MPTIRLIDRTGYYRVSNREQDGCSWCGERPANGHLYSYFKTHAEAEETLRWNGLFHQPAFCGLHCWGQENGWTEL